MSVTAAPSDPKPADPPSPPPRQGASKRQYWGYLARIIFVVLVAILFSKRDVIKSSVSDIFVSKPGMNEDLNQVNPLTEPEIDDFNPIFDSEYPPEPIYSKSGTRMITKNELAAHGNSGPLTPIWLAMMGKVFDVSKGAEHYYGPKGGYKFFSGIDGSKAFVTGEFNKEGLTDDVSELAPLQLDELENWIQFYGKDYTYVGKLIGRYYTRDGKPTKEWYKYQKRLGEKDLIKAEMRKMEQRYPGCNSEWTQVKDGRVYCSKKSGGVARNWVGYPRRFFAPGTTNWRCACVNDEDLSSPNMRMYPRCDPTSFECKINAEEIKKLREKEK